MTSTAATLPTHLGIILDGNRRWAKQNNQSTKQGHTKGLEAFMAISLACFERGIPYVSAYIFSTENWQRTQDEVSFLMGLVSHGIEKHLDSFHQAGVKLLMLGAREGLDQKVLTVIDGAVQKTKHNLKGTLALCFNYGGHQEIVQAAQSLAAKEQSITEESLAAALYAPEIPPIDLVVRTSGEKRLSGFMLWRAAYSELYFTDVMWPDFTSLQLDQALQDYAHRQRRFGN